jgi:beta-lactam-binding protein with PASTA domain/tRNA A-37 threonylcarbamoyl transferase component Bud32
VESCRVTDAYEEGQLIDGRYPVLRKIGAGGMADVYLARDETLGRQVAVKVLLPRYADDRQFVERFRREAQAAAGLNHPNIVSIYDRGQVGSTYYIVMEYLRGETLKDFVRRNGRLAPREAIGIALELLAAVQYAHDHRVVHRDIKSQNIMLDEHGRAKVTDFGIARAGDPSMTEVGAVLGTAQYLSPEQAKGQPADERSDLYSVGVVLYEMLTGRVPFRGDTAVSVALKHVNELPPEPIAVVADLPPSLNRVVLKALAKNPERRYNSAAQFASDLRAVVSGGPLVAASYDVGDERTQVVAPLPIGDEATRVMAADGTAATARVAPGGPVPATAGPAGRPRRKRRRVWPWILLLALIALAAFGGFLLFRTLTGTAVAVPGVVGQQQATAVSQLKKAGFGVTTQSVYSDQYQQPGIVARQSPVGGTDLRKGETVTIWVSKGPQHFQLDNLFGLTAKKAADYLKANGLVGKPLTGNSTQTPGTVFRQDPAAFATVARGDTVSYWVSKGPAQVAVPDVTSMSQSQAESAIRGAGLLVGTVTPSTSSSVPAGDVISQAPNPGAKVDKGSSVSIVVSSGLPPSPSPSPSPSLVKVPNVLTMDQGTAATTLGNAGFQVAVKQKGGTGQPAGTVVDQSPLGDTKAAAGSTVTITVAK